MNKDPKVFFEHILECIKLIEKYTIHKNKTNFINSPQLQDSVIRRIEIIGEAVKNIPDEIKNNYRDIPWKNIAGMRDVLIHDYFGVDIELTWSIVVKEIPVLKRKILKIMKELY